MGFGISSDTDEKRVDYDIDDQNFLRDYVRFSRSNQVLNEEQAAVVLMAVATGWFGDHEYNTSAIVTGGSSGGKSHMLDEVVFATLDYADDVHDVLYELTGGSDKAAIDDEDIDDALAAYFHELQKIPDEMLEFIKTVAEDGQFKYGRNVPDPDSDSGRKTAHIEREPLPVVFSFADENEAAAGKDQELRTRTVEVKVDESEEKNEGVHDAKWGGENIELSDSEFEYMFDDPDLDHAVKAHMRDMPIGVDVVIPYGNDKYEGDDWCASDVVKPMFNFARSESTRASANLAGLTMGSAIVNYHARDAVCDECQDVYGPSEASEHDWQCPSCDDGEMHIIAEETDVGNLIACRNTLLATTHGLTEKKFAVLDAIRARGGRANTKGTAVQATKQDIVDEIQENDDIATMTKSEIEGILEELDEHLIINKKDNPEDRRENLYVYDGGSVFQSPDIYGDGERYERFKDVEDPIRQQPIEQTIEEQLDELNAKMDMDSLGTGEAMGGESDDTGLDSFEDDGGPSLSDDAEAVAERLKSTISGRVVPADVFEDNALRTGHMVGDTPVEYETVDGVEYVRPEREPSGDDRIDGFMSPDHSHWDDDMSFNDIETAIEGAIEELREKGVLQFEGQSDGGQLVTVDA